MTAERKVVEYRVVQEPPEPVLPPVNAFKPGDMIETVEPFNGKTRFKAVWDGDMRESWLVWKAVS